MNKVKAVFVGRRIISDSNLAGAFKVPGKKDLVYFPRVKFAEIGREYWLGNDGEDYSSHRFPEACDPEANVKETLEIKNWIARQATDENAVRRYKKQKQTAKNEDAKAIARQLKAYCEGMSYLEVKAVVEFLIEEATK